MEKSVKCPWCGTTTVPVVTHLDSNYGIAVERRCEHCRKIVASYLQGEGDFFPKIRVFSNE